MTLRNGESLGSIALSQKGEGGGKETANSLKRGREEGGFYAQQLFRGGRVSDREGMILPAIGQKRKGEGILGIKKRRKTFRLSAVRKKEGGQDRSD